MQKIRGFEPVTEKHRKDTADYVLPMRGTAHSAGYDFASPVNEVVMPNNNIVIWTNVKAYMHEGEVLMVYIRSSTGIKKGLTIANGTGIIDKDYYNNENNDGNIAISLYNNTKTQVVIEKGERIAQGIFLSFLEADNGNTDTVRTGGIGSSSGQI